MNPELDGVNHINIYSKARTDIGRFLSNFSDSPRGLYIDTEDGEFRTIEGYWYWLSTKDDRLRDLPGYQCKKLGRELRGQDWNDDPDFKRKILLAIFNKISSHNDMCIKLVETKNLPLYHYYEYKGKVFMPKDGLWMVSFIEHVRLELATGIICLKTDS